MKTPEQWAAYVQDQLGDGVSLTEEHRVLVYAFDTAITEARADERASIEDQLRKVLLKCLNPPMKGTE